jgi:hypothetical protein
MFDQTVNFVTHTNGRGYWSTVSGCVKINRVRIAYLDDELDFGELRAYFDPQEWDTDKDGLIYTDPAWMQSFRNCMATLGFSEAALQDIDYSEQGMQGDNYVSMDVGGDFIRECEALYRFCVLKRAVNLTEA